MVCLLLQHQALTMNVRNEQVLMQKICDTEMITSIANLLTSAKQ